MTEPKQSLVQSWLIKAEHDLILARNVSSIPGALLDVGIFHCQQAAEKAVKGFLVFHDLRFEKTHDIELLMSTARSVQSTFEAWLACGASLTPYAARFRYPGEVMQPSQQEYSAALQAAEAIVQFVTSLLPAEVRPNPTITPIQEGCVSD